MLSSSGQDLDRVSLLQSIVVSVRRTAPDIEKVSGGRRALEEIYAIIASILLDKEASVHEETEQSKATESVRTRPYSSSRGVDAPLLLHPPAELPSFTVSNVCRSGKDEHRSAQRDLPGRRSQLTQTHSLTQSYTKDGDAIPDLQSAPEGPVQHHEVLTVAELDAEAGEDLQGHEGIADDVAQT